MLFAGFGRAAALCEQLSPADPLSFDIAQDSNLAVGLAKLGHEVLWISRLGEDEFGHYVQNMIRSEGVDTRAVRFDEANPTGIMFKETSRGETAVYYYRKHSAASAMEPEDLDESLFEEAEILHITGITPVLSECP